MKTQNGPGAWRRLVDVVNSLSEAASTPRGAAPDRAELQASLRSERR